MVRTSDQSVRDPPVRARNFIPSQFYPSPYHRSIMPSPNNYIAALVNFIPIPICGGQTSPQLVPTDETLSHRWVLVGDVEVKTPRVMRGGLEGDKIPGAYPVRGTACRSTLLALHRKSRDDGLGIGQQILVAFRKKRERTSPRRCLSSGP